MGALIFLAVFATFAAIVMLLWNALIPAIIGWAAIGYWQAAGLIVLCRLLLGGFGKIRHMGMHGMHGCHSHHHHDSEAFREMREGLKGMSREQRREYIRRHFAEIHGFGSDCCEPRDLRERDRATAAENAATDAGGPASDPEQCPR